MPEQVQNILNKITEWWKKFNTKQKALLISIVAVIIVALAILAAVVSKPNMVTLHECQTTAEAGTVKDLAVCGLYLLCMTGGSFRLQRGDLYTLCCALIFSLQILAVDHYAPIADNTILACIEFFTCGICSLIPMFLLEQPRMHLILAAWLPILYAGILSNGVAYTLQFFAQRGLPASTASLLMSTESVFSLLAGFLILHQMLNGRELAGCALMFAAIILVQIKGKEKESINS